MPDAARIYCFDTSALIHAWVRAYPPKHFSGLWKELDGLIAAERMLSSVEVYNELKKKDDELADWAKSRKNELFREIDSLVQGAVVTLMRKYPKLVDTNKGKSGADPFVIAQAMSANPMFIVVTQEDGGSQARPKIPYVCAQEGVTCMCILDVIQAENWSF
ncbi:MAG: DUF4411 family protein [Beijerinckiaceae bacterium]|nr:DUF4411 family protein [Beijerinckiaceae bacterium]